MTSGHEGNPFMGLPAKKRNPLIGASYDYRSERCETVSWKKEHKCMKKKEETTWKP